MSLSRTHPPVALAAQPVEFVADAEPLPPPSSPSDQVLLAARYASATSVLTEP